MKKIFIIVLILLSRLSDAQANDPEEGYAVIRSDTIYGQIKINFDAGTITVKQDSINRMFLSDIKLITLLNNERETYLPMIENEKTSFYRLLVKGEYPLLKSSDEAFYTSIEDHIIAIEEEKDLYDLFGKKEVKNYIFIRNIDLTNEIGLQDVFRNFN